MNTADFKKSIEINLYGSVYVAKYVVPILAKNPLFNNKERGLFLFIGSICGEEAHRAFISYGAAKGAINAILMPMARDLGSVGIRVLSLSPSQFETEMTRNISEEGKKFLMRDIPLGRFGECDEFA